MKIEKYKFDNAYEKIYEYKDGAYFYIGNYISYGIKKNMAYDKKVKTLETNQF